MITTSRFTLLLLAGLVISNLTVGAQTGAQGKPALKKVRFSPYVQLPKAPSANPPVNQNAAQTTAATAPATVSKADSKSNTTQEPRAQQLYSHGDPTPEEQQLLEYINRARANPTEEGIRLATTTDTRVSSAYTYFKIDRNLLKTQFATYPERPPLAFHAKLITAARNHCNDMKQNNFQGHYGTDGSNPGQRMTKAGYTNVGAWGENVAAYSESTWHAHCGLNVDWGEQNQIELGHRHNIMNFAGSDVVYKEIGIGAIAGAGGGQVGPLIVTQDLTYTAEVYILGVVYKDKNNNGFYDIGEGISGVTITPSRGNYYAVTSTSGGYAIPMKGTTGSVTITATGNGINEVKSVSLSNENVKVDFGQQTTPSVILRLPGDATNVGTDTVRLVWNKIPSGKNYWLQVSTDENFATTMVNDSARTDSSYILRNVDNVTTYYWRVKAKHTTLGWGDFSPPFSFNVSIVPGVVTLISPQPNAFLSKKPITFTWTKGKPGAKEYWLEIATDKDFHNTVFDNTELTDTTFDFTDENSVIEVDVDYYWHVSAFNDAGQGEYTPARTFRISTVGVNDEKETAPLVINMVAPNPVQATSYIRFMMQQAGTAELALYDVRGNRVATIAKGFFESGMQTVELNMTQGECASLASGTYYVQLRVGGKTHNRALILTR